MNKHIKQQMMEILELLSKEHDVLIKHFENNDIEATLNCLSECQNTALAIGQKIDAYEGEGSTSVKALEEYCELIFQIYTQVSNGDDIKSNKLSKSLKKSYINITNIMKNDIKVKKEVVFLPYKASMWDSLETVWQKADADPEVEAKVIPIPYYDKNPDGSFGEYHYEGILYPEYVPITPYENYDLKLNHPDEIYIHNPYDDTNFVTSIPPEYYSKKIREYTDKLIYIPYFVLEEIDPDDENAIEGLKNFIENPAVIYADEVIVQSENMRKAYIEHMVKITGEENRKFFSDKIKGTGSPKIEKLKKMSRDDVTVPDEWKKYISRSDGSRKKIILYNTSLNSMLRHSDTILTKLLKVFDTFKENKDNVVLLWRPHPLMEATMYNMRPHLLESYKKIVQLYKSEDIGIYDDSTDLDRALVISDAYYGDPSSLVTLCKAINKPIMIQNVAVGID